MYILFQPISKQKYKIILLINRYSLKNIFQIICILFSTKNFISKNKA